LADEGDALTCLRCKTSYASAAGVPVLVDFGESVLDPAWMEQTHAASPIGERNPRRARGGHMQVVAANLERLRSLLPASPRVLVVGGGVNEHGLDWMYSSPATEVIGFDVYTSPLTQFVADAHRIPLNSGSVDCVVAQAILEHVLEPERVVAEIHRVLKPGGIVYAETAFLQAVHEGAFDFVRFTERGHRWLFRHFEEIESGAIGGAGLSLVWALDYFARSLTKTPRWGQRLRRFVRWLGAADAPGHAPSIDAATAVYFLGRRSEESLSRRELIAGHRGARPRRAES
jgi:SAM-dependent methyltransferase